jgi:hypothetical protein
MSNDWAKGGGDFDSTTSSGNTCRIREVSLTDLVFDGVIDNIDSLSAIVNSKITKKKSGGREKTDQQKALEMLKSASEIKDALAIMDKVVVHVVVEPKISPLPEDGKFEDDVVYISNIPLEDRTDIFMRAIKEVKAAESFRPE